VETTVDVGAEFRVRRTGRRREGAHHDLAAGRERAQAPAKEMAQSALDPMTDHGVAHDPADHEADLRRALLMVSGEVSGEQVQHESVAATAATLARHASQVVTAGEAMRRR
jgi:hypothetical protein